MNPSVRVSSMILCGLALIGPLLSDPVCAAGTKIALLDINYVFKNHTAFQQQIEQIKQELKAIEGQLKRQHEQIMDMQKRLVAFKPGSPEYMQLEQQIVTQKANVQVRTDLTMKDLRQREARLYFDQYSLVLREVAVLANTLGIDMVQRFDRNQIDPASRAEILRGVNRPIIYQRSELDISEAVLRRLNEPRRVSQAPRPNKQRR